MESYFRRFLAISRFRWRKLGAIEYQPAKVIGVSRKLPLGTAAAFGLTDSAVWFSFCPAARFLTHRASEWTTLLFGIVFTSITPTIGKIVIRPASDRSRLASFRCG